MTQAMPDDLWRDFPKTATEFEARFATEEGCRAYWIDARWGGEPACARCNSTRVWTIREGTTFECADCWHQTSLTSGTLLEKTRKPLKMWFRAIFEISTRRTGISAKDLQRIMGFGSYKTACCGRHDPCIPGGAFSERHHFCGSLYGAHHRSAVRVDFQGGTISMPRSMTYLELANRQQ